MVVNVTNIVFDGMNQCRLDQYALVESTSKLPKVGFYFVLAVLIVLVLRQLVEPWTFKWLKYSIDTREVIRESLVGFSFALSVWATILLFYFTFQLSSEKIKLIEQVVIYTLIPLCIFGLYYNRKNLVNMFRGLK